jgi:prepilin-type N-terminal cleavage/methylation domain-containing protein
MINLLRRMRGFTLIELLVVIAIIAILAAVLTPAVTDALTRGKMTGTLANGRSIYQALFAKDLEDPVFQTGSPYPRKGGLDISIRQFPNSTEYFRWVVTSAIMNVDFSFFSAPGIPPARTTNAVNFNAENNGWCISGGTNISAVTDTAPLLYTRNIQCAGDKTDGVLTLSENPPFGKKGVPTIAKGGASYVLKQDTISNFNPSAVSLDVLTP